jgi:hypothetical protein
MVPFAELQITVVWYNFSEAINGELKVDLEAVPRWNQVSNVSSGAGDGQT